MTTLALATAMAARTKARSLAFVFEDVVLHRDRYEEAMAAMTEAERIEKTLIGEPSRGRSRRARSRCAARG